MPLWLGKYNIALKRILFGKMIIQNEGFTLNIYKIRM